MLSHTMRTVTFLGGLFIAACNRDPSPPAAGPAANPTPAPGTLAASASRPDVYPLANGCAYIRASKEPLWYVCGDTAGKLSGLSLSAFAKIYPLADGTALAVNRNSGKLYSLRGTEAVEITEGVPSPPPSAIAGSPARQSGFHFVSAAQQSRRAEKAEADRPIEGPEG